MRANICVIFVILVSTTGAQQTLEDVEAALQEFDDLQLSLTGTLHLFMNNQTDSLRTQLDEMRVQTTQEIDDQLASIWAKITTMVDNVESTTGRNVSSACVSTSESELEDFGTELKDRVGECGGYMIMTANERVYSVWSRIWQEYDVDFECSKMALAQCRDYAGNENCPTAVYSVVQGAKTKLEKSFEMFTAEMSNQILGMNVPCRQMILQELALYPGLILNFVKSCLDSAFADSYFSC